MVVKKASLLTTVALVLIVAMPLPAAADEAQQRAHLARILAKEPASLQAFYAAREGRLAWRERQAVAAFADAIRNLDADGLNPDDYRPGALLALHREAYATPGAFEAQAKFDLMLSQCLHLVLHHLHRGKLDPRDLAGGETQSRCRTDCRAGRWSAFRAGLRHGAAGRAAV